MLDAYIGLGSNIDNPLRQVEGAVRALVALEGSALIGPSSFYRSKPVGLQHQPDFVNAVLGLRTAIPAHDLLDRLQDIEKAHKRVRKQRWGPRTLDLDLLLYGEERIDSERLTVPHPEMVKRNFVLIPLYEIAPRLTIPGLGRLADLVKQVNTDELELISADECHP